MSEWKRYHTYYIPNWIKYTITCNMKKLEIRGRIRRTSSQHFTPPLMHYYNYHLAQKMLLSPFLFSISHTSSCSLIRHLQNIFTSESVHISCIEKQHNLTVSQFLCIGLIQIYAMTIQMDKLPINVFISSYHKDLYVFIN